MSDEIHLASHDVGTDRASEGAGGWRGAGGPLEFMGFDMNVSRQELLETVDAWHNLIRRISRDRDVEKDRRAADLVLRTHLRCGAACCVLGDWVTAVADLEVVRNAKDAPELLVQGAIWMLSAAYAAQWQYAQAVDCWSAILTEYEKVGTKKGNSLTDPDITMLYLFRAQVHAEERQFAKAIIDCDRAEYYHPECAEVFSVRGLCRAHLGDMERARADCDRSIEVDPCSARGFRRRGTVRRMCREFMPAVADFDRALELDPADEHARTGRSEAMLGYVLFDLASVPPPAPGEATQDERTESGGETDERSPSEAVESAN